MPLVTEHLRPSGGEWRQVEHRWSVELTLNMSTLIEEDGGPHMAHASGYGDLYERRLVDHTFTQDYLLPDKEPMIRKGDRIRMWREQVGMIDP